MITSETPYKLAEIIRDTWPGLFCNNKINSGTNKNKNVQIQNTRNNQSH